MPPDSAHSGLKVPLHTVSPSNCCGSPCSPVPLEPCADRTAYTASPVSDATVKDIGCAVIVAGAVRDIVGGSAMLNATSPERAQLLPSVVISTRSDSDDASPYSSGFTSLAHVAPSPLNSAVPSASTSRHDLCGVSVSYVHVNSMSLPRGVVPGPLSTTVDGVENGVTFTMSE